MTQIILEIAVPNRLGEKWFYEGGLVSVNESPDMFDRW